MNSSIGLVFSSLRVTNSDQPRSGFLGGAQTRPLHLARASDDLAKALLLARLVLVVANHDVARLFVGRLASFCYPAISLSFALGSLRALSALCVALPVRQMGHAEALALNRHV